MFNRQWAELNAFTASFGIANNDHPQPAPDAPNPPGASDPAHDPAAASVAPAPHALQHHQSSDHHFHSHADHVQGPAVAVVDNPHDQLFHHHQLPHHQPTSVSHTHDDHHHNPFHQPPQQQQSQQHHQLQDYSHFDFEPSQDWSRFALDASNNTLHNPHQQQQHQQPQATSTDAAGPQLIHHHHHHHHHHHVQPNNDFASDGMDWTPSGDMGGADFASAFGTGSLHHQESSASIKMEPDYLDQSHNLMDAVSHHQHQQPALPPRPSDSVMMGDHGMSDSHNMASSATSPMPIHHHQQPSSPAPQAHSQSHSQPPPQAHFAAFDTASHTNPFATGNNPFVASNHTASTDAADIFGSLDGFVAPNQHHHHHHHLSPSPMASSSSPAPPTPAPSSAAATTAGFASWVPPPQQAQPQSQPRQLSQTNPFVQHHLTPQPFTPQSFAPSPAANGHPARINSPGAGYFGSVSSTPAPHVQQQHVPPPQPQQPPSVAMNQFILEMDRASSAATPAVKGKTPVKPPKPRAHRPSVPGSSRMVLSPAAPSATALLKQEAPSMQQQQSPMSVPPVPVKEPTPQPSVAAAAASRPHAREQVSAEAWEEHKDQIHDLYLEQRKPLKEVMAIMADKHNFHATPKMYKTRFSQWGFVKNNTEDEVKKLLSMKFQRDAEGKVSEFVRNGKIINLGTYLKRKGVTEYDLVDFELPVDLPSHIRCRTPTPPPAPDYLGTPELVRAQELVVGCMRKAFLQCRQWETETNRDAGWPSTMVWGAPSSEMLTEANFYLEAGDADSGGQCLMNAFNQLEMDLKQMSPQAMMEMVLGMVRRDAGLMTALCKYVAAFATTNYERAHPVRQMVTCLYEVQQRHGAMAVSELLWGSAPLVAEELEAIYGRRHPYVARVWIDLALFYDQRDGERLERLASELRDQQKAMERRRESKSTKERNKAGAELSDVLAIRYAAAQLLYAARPTSDESRKAARDLFKFLRKERLLFRVKDSTEGSSSKATPTYCYHCAVKNDPWTKRCRRRYDSVVEMLQRHADVKILPYFEEDFHTLDHHDEPEGGPSAASSAWSAVMGQPVPNSRWRFI